MMVASIAVILFTFGRGVIGLSLAHIRLNISNRQALINTNVPNAIADFFRHWLNYLVIAAESQDITQLLCNMLDRAFRAIRASNNNNGDFHENLAIMVIDGALRLGDNPLITSDEFNRHGITLVVVAVTTPTNEIWNYYRILAQNTGGEYMLFSGAAVRLKRVLVSALNGEDTLRQAFRHMPIENVPLVEIPIGDMNEQNQAATDVGELDFDHGLS